MPAKAVELVMFEEELCEWCEQWDLDIGVVYDRTIEGKKAPLRRSDIDFQHDFKGLVRPISYTPTFVLLDKGQEVGRIIGYPGEHFFWPMLKNLLGRLQHSE